MLCKFTILYGYSVVFLIKFRTPFLSNLVYFNLFFSYLPIAMQEGKARNEESAISVVFLVFLQTVGWVRVFFSLSPSASQAGSYLKISANLGQPIWSQATNKHTQTVILLLKRIDFVILSIYRECAHFWKWNN